ncbi:hypothetical protein ACFX15_002982 [Malus domestica]
MRNQLCGNYGQLCQKARNLYSSPIHRLPTLSERTVPVVKTSPISFYFRLPQQKHTLSAHPLNTSSSPKMHSQRILSSHSVFLIPWDTPANNPFKAKVFHIIKVESKSISYHAFSMSFSLSLFSDKEKESNQPAFGINLPIWSQLPGTPS